MEGRLTFLAIMILAILGLPYPEVCSFSVADNIYPTLSQKQECLLQFEELDERKVLDPRIIGGEIVVGRKFPFMVQVLVFESCVCGGSILNEYWIVTAAHCMDFRFDFEVEMAVNIGSNLLYKGKRYEVELQIPHENYVEDVKNTPCLNDIGLLKLAEPIEFVPGVERMKLPEPFEEVPLGTEVIAVGWGVTDLNKTGSNDLKMIMKRITTAKIAAFIYEFEHYHVFAEADYPDTVYEGDSGGPLLWGDKVVGIASMAFPERGLPAVFTKLSHFLSWINGKIYQT